MKIPKLVPGNVVVVDWADSKSLLGWSYAPNAKREPGYIRTIGYVVQANEECLTVTTSMDDRGASIDDFSIPVGCVRNIDLLPDEFNAPLRKK